jgi:hypothetical protein
VNAAGVHLPGSALLFFLPLFTNYLEKLFGKSVGWRLGRTFSPTFDGNNGLSGPSRRLMKVPL